MRGQVAVEFIIILAFMMVLLAVAAGISFQKSLETEGEMADLEAEMVLHEAASAVNTAHIEGDGFRTTIVLPETVGGRNYTIRMSAALIWMEVGGSFHSDIMLTGNVTGDFVPGENTVKNAGGGVFLNT
jgi:hypothetical protein